MNHIAENDSIDYTIEYENGARDGEFTRGHISWEFAFFPNAGSIVYIDGEKFNVPQYSVMSVPYTATVRMESCDAQHRRIEVYVSDRSLRELCSSLFAPHFYEHLSEMPRTHSLSKQEYRFIANRLSKISDGGFSKRICRDLVRVCIISVLSFFYQEIGNKTKKDDAPKWLKNFVEKLHEPSCFCMRISEIMKSVNYSKSRFTHLFKIHYGCTLTEYVSDLKLAHAKDLLQYGDESILNISIILGYASLPSFTSFFKRNVGITPSEYRHSCRDMTARSEEAAMNSGEEIQ